MAVFAPVVCTLLQHSAGFPEVDADIFLDWSSQSLAPDTEPEPEACSLPSTLPCCVPVSAAHAIDLPEQQQADSSLTWPSATVTSWHQLTPDSVCTNSDATQLDSSRFGSSQACPQAPTMAPPSLQMPKLAPMDIPPEMPSGPSIATARVSTANIDGLTCIVSSPCCTATVMSLDAQSGESV